MLLFVADARDKDWLRLGVGDDLICRLRWQDGRGAETDAEESYYQGPYSLCPGWPAPLADPLVAGGYLGAYPRSRQASPLYLNDAVFHWRLRWRCAVPPAAAYLPPGSAAICPALGGLATGIHGERQAFGLGFGSRDRLLAVPALPAFGYSRADQAGAANNSAPSCSAAKLFFYYQDAQPLPQPLRQLFGLDVLNAATGELVPDGLPDGVILVIDLHEGQITNTSRSSATSPSGTVL